MIADFHKPSRARKLTAETKELEVELERAQVERASLGTAGDVTHQELRELLDQEIRLLEDTLTAKAALNRVQSSVTWRILEAFRRSRLALRHVLMRYRGRRRCRASLKLPAFAVTAPLGVNVAGYLNTESGMGEAARLSIRSLNAAEIPVSLNNVPSFLRMGDDAFANFTDTNPHPFNLIHLNADNMESFARARGREYFRDRYTIGYWFWELSEFRKDWMSAFSIVDEVWVATEFGRRALGACAPVPVVRMPLPLVPTQPAALDRSHFRLGQDAFVFLFTFDVSSQIERKNPGGLVSAFRRAFEARRDVILMLKLTNPEYDPSGMRKLYSAVNGSNVVLWEEYMTRGELTALMSCTDCYVSLHRSEGFGLGIAEAMALGKPVIATHYSGPADFMTIENSYPVDYTVVPIPRDYGPYLEGLSWADPDLAHASALMREVVENRVDAERRGRRAAADMAEHYAPERTGARIRRRLEDIRSGHARITTQD